MTDKGKDMKVPGSERIFTPEEDIEIAPEEPEEGTAESAEKTAPAVTEGPSEETAKEAPETAAEETEEVPEEAPEEVPEEMEETPEEAPEEVPEEVEVAPEEVEEAPEEVPEEAPDDFEAVRKKAPEKAAEEPSEMPEPDLAMAVVAGMIKPKPAPAQETAKTLKETVPGTDQGTVKKKKSKKGLFTFCGILLALAAGCGIWAWNFWQTQHASTVFFERTYLNGENIAGKTPAEIRDGILQKNDQIKISLNEGSQVSAEGSAKDFGLTLDEAKLTKSLEDALKAQTDSPAAAFKSLYEDSTITTEEAWNLDEDVLYEKIDARNLLVNREASFDAYLDFDEEKNCAVIVPEIYGTRFKKEDLRAFMKNTLLSDFSVGLLSADSKYAIAFPEDIYIKPKVTKEDPDLNALCDSYNKYAGTNITYTFGDEKVELTFKEICDMLTVSGNSASLNKEDVAAYVAKLAEKYDTRGVDRTYVSHDGYETEFDASQIDYGYMINQEAETEQLYEEILSHEEVSREPVYYVEDKWGNPYYYSRNGVDDLNGTFIEVSLADQHVWFYKNGELIVDTDCVTGNLSRKMGTSRGMYPITFKKSPAVLRGGSGKSAYATPVTYWMPFNGGQGLHDATWRSRFGGNIYKSSGSHGCVNLPKKAAAVIYENCKPGMCVIVY